MKPSLFLTAFPIVLAASVTQAQTIPECQARVLRPFTDEIGDAWTTGKLLPVDIIRVEHGATSYCAHGGGCFPRVSNGRQVFSLTNCKQGPAIGNGDYRLVADPKTMGAAAARRFTTQYRVSSRLGDLGLSNASAATYATTYVLHPRSTDGRLVTRALAGSKSALATLRAKTP